MEPGRSKFLSADADGNTQFYLPGDPQYKDPRGFTDFPDLPGQSLNPIFDNPEAQ